LKSEFDEDLIDLFETGLVKWSRDSNDQIWLHATEKIYNVDVKKVIAEHLKKKYEVIQK